jgi:WD40 repeat protein
VDIDRDTIVYGHEYGVTLLEPTDEKAIAGYIASEFQRRFVFRPHYMHLDQAVHRVRIWNGIILTAHHDHSLQYINLSQDSPDCGRPIQLPHRHESFINSIDISPNGRLLASTGDDKKLVVFDRQLADAAPMVFTLAGVGRAVRFLGSTPESSRIAVLESSNRIRIIDLVSREFLVTIYVGASESCHDISTGIGGGFDVAAVGATWWRDYNILDIQGGCGYTAENAALILNSPRTSTTVLSRNGKFGASVHPQGAVFHELDKGDLGRESPIDHDLTAHEFASPALSAQGDVLAVVSGKSLVLFHNGTVL